MANSAVGSFNMYFPGQITVSYNPKGIDIFYINYFPILY
jgi:hypothetical protein